MSQIPASIAPLLSSIAPNPRPIPTPTAATVAAAASSKMVMNPSQIQRNKLQNVPAFLNKLYSMVDDHTTDELIRWSDDGKSFNVVRHEEFAKKVLPRFFKHSNFSSFVRQLNMYGFHKVPHLQNGVLSTEGETERWEFSNPHFQRNQPDLLLLVTRKKGRDPEEKETGAVDLHHILDEIAAIKKHQMSISNELKNVQTDNQVLWQENVASRERHVRHQETIDKILRFLASVFSSEKNKHVVIPRKRRYLLEDVTENDNTNKVGKKREYNKIEDVEDEEDEDQEPVLKQSRISTTPQFDLSEFVNDAVSLPINQNLLLSSTPSPNPATADLAAAIALNDQTKKVTAASLVAVPNLNTNNNDHIHDTLKVNNTQPPQSQHQQLQPQQPHHQQHTNNNTNTTISTPTTTNSTPDLSSLLNLPQFQGLVSLAQSNPALFNQLTNSTYFDVPETPIIKAAPPFIKTEPLQELTGLLTPDSVVQAPILPSTAEDLENSLKSLATELGFENNNEMDYVNMDDFLNTYTQSSPANTTTPATTASTTTTATTNDNIE